jgi:hypothetical protein
MAPFLTVLSYLLFYYDNTARGRHSVYVINILALSRKEGAHAMPLTYRREAGGVLLASCHWNVIMSVRLSVTAFGFRGSFRRFALPEFKTL